MICLFDNCENEAFSEIYCNAHKQKKTKRIGFMIKESFSSEMDDDLEIDDSVDDIGKFIDKE